MTPDLASPADCAFTQSPFSRDCPQRPFESMISVLRKLPWYKTDCITIKQRHSIFNACVQLIRLLQNALKDGKNEEHLTQVLLKRLWTSAMLCHGFTVTMRDSIAYLADIPDHRLREFNMPRFADMWVHAYTLCPKPDTPLDVLEVCCIAPPPFAALHSILCSPHRTVFANQSSPYLAVLHRHHPRGDPAHCRPPAAQHPVPDPQGGIADQPVLGLLLQGAEPPPRPGL